MKCIEQYYVYEVHARGSSKQLPRIFDILLSLLTFQQFLPFSLILIFYLKTSFSFPASMSEGIRSDLTYTERQ